MNFIQYMEEENKRDSTLKRKLLLVDKHLEREIAAAQLSSEATSVCGANYESFLRGWNTQKSCIYIIQGTKFLKQSLSVPEVVKDHMPPNFY